MTRVVETLRAAALSTDGRELLASGTLTKELQETGWDLLSGLAPEKPPPARARPASKPERHTRTRPAGDAQREAEKQQRQALRKELRAARQRRTELARELREARRDEEKLSQSLERKRKEIGALEAELAEVDATIERAGGA